MPDDAVPNVHYRDYITIKNYSGVILLYDIERYTSLLLEQRPGIETNNDSTNTI